LNLEFEKAVVALIFVQENPGETVKEYIRQIEENEFLVKEVINPVQGDTEDLKELLFDLAMKKVSLIITLGGAGFKNGDTVPEATACIIDKRLPGLENTLMYSLMEKGSFSIINRGISGIFQESIIINLPDKPFIVKQILNTILPLIKWTSDNF